MTKEELTKRAIEIAGGYEDVVFRPGEEATQIYQEIVELAERYAESQRPKWIGKNERLPERNQQFLIYLDNQIKVCWRVNNAFYIAEEYEPFVLDSRFIDWMPIPEPPREEP